jgi:anhydro-N-acetylmuramic acid kinase
MSGTSLDGLDIACVNFSFSDNQWSYQFVHTETIPYPDQLQQAFLNPFSWVGSQFADYDEAYCSFVANSVRVILDKLKDFHPTLIASHGQTLFHQPHSGYTFQLGNGAKIAAKVGVPCVSDFRTADVALGGQGAPLVPTGDQLLFPEFDNCLNIGGFANCSFKHSEKRIAFDIAPANFVLNQLAMKVGKKYDNEGSIAASGEIIPELLEKLNSIDFYSLKPPKSLGAEFVEQSIEPILQSFNKNIIPDLIATYTEHLAIQIANNLKPGNCLLTGGGTKNQHLVNRIKFHSHQTELVVPSDQLIDFKEAMVFALLGVLRWFKQENVLASVTGSKRNHCAGTIHP